MIRAVQPDASVAFYTSLGLSFVRHRHGKGPEHFAAEQGSYVLEIYPASAGEETRNCVRLGFSVENADELAARFERHGVRIASPLKESPWGRRMVVLDPDDNRVEISVRHSTGSGTELETV